MTTPDVKWIEKLRKENLDQYFTLVRMHLSFVVDINTDDVDCSTDKPKQFRWNFHKKTKNSNTNSSQSNANGIRNNLEPNSITEDGILRLNELIDFLAKKENVTQEGIFRRTGSLSRQQELRQLLLTGSNLGLEDSKFSVHDCASVLKGFLADLPQPLLMDQYYQTYCTLAVQYPPNAESSITKLLTALQLLLLLLTPSHRSFLERLLRLLRLVADNEASNRMSPDTLATMFTPHLLCPRKLSPETFHTDSLALSPVISFMIRHSEDLFRAPKQLGTDAAAYFTVRERKRLMSPDVDLDESITDKTAANTVYTFVDRNRTCAENARNPTDTALAQLYAHIQALPDSAHKRRLVKHFNRQNGYGTPIQIQRTGKVAGTRSFGDSIKRHIFNKGLLNKTPKKGSGSNINTVEEESIMTPRSRKPLIITSEQRDSLPEGAGGNAREGEETVLKGEEGEREAAGPNNDSDFVSSDDDVTPRFASCHRSTSNSAIESQIETRSLSEPFRDYLLSRSVLTAAPVDLSVLERSGDRELSESLMYCLDGHSPCDLTASISGLAVDNVGLSIDNIEGTADHRVQPSPLREANERKRSAPRQDGVDYKKQIMGKENLCDFTLRETDL